MFIYSVFQFLLDSWPSTDPYSNLSKINQKLYKCFCMHSTMVFTSTPSTKILSFLSRRSSIDIDIGILNWVEFDICTVWPSDCQATNYARNEQNLQFDRHRVYCYSIMGISLTRSLLYWKIVANSRD